jgi:hypothetical protein
MTSKVFLATRDLVSRAKLGAVVAAAGGELVRDAAACELAVIEIDGSDWEHLVRILVSRGIPVIAYGAHVRADLLRAARDAGATAVPNSEVQHRLRQLLAG